MTILDRLTGGRRRATSDRERPPTGRWPPLVAAALGAAFFVTVAGWRVVSPVSIDWVMQADWRIHFLGWHLFRGEPWTWPPGRVLGYYAPAGTAIGFTDSIPLVALPLKAVAHWLPLPFQYLGLWLTLCFALQGYWGARLAGLWTRDRLAMVLGGLLFVLLPTLLNRAPHPALSSHWLLLWALYLYLASSPRAVLPAGSMLLIAAIAGLLHPYLAVMVLALLGALTLRAVLDNRDHVAHGWTEAAVGPAVVLTGAVALIVCGWWASGLFTAADASMARPGLTRYSMDLLGPVMPRGWSAWLPEFAAMDDERAFEGLQYLGLGAIALVCLGAILAGARRSLSSGERLWPLLAVCGALAVYSLSPRVTWADRVVVDYWSPALEPLAVFGVTGRFFWPAAYLMVALALRSVLRCLASGAALVVLAAAVLVQAADTRPGYLERYQLTRTALFHHFPGKPASSVWAQALPRYRHVALVLPAHCAETTLAYELAGYLAGLYGLTVNAGEMARPSQTWKARYCESFTRALQTGAVRDDTVYLVDPSREAWLRSAAPSLACGQVDTLRVCVTRASYLPWRDVADFN